MEAEKDYGIASYGAKLSRAKLHMRKMELEVQLCLSRLIDAREAAEIAAILDKAGSIILHVEPNSVGCINFAKNRF